jgi:hypothetical protein
MGLCCVTDDRRSVATRGRARSVGVVAGGGGSGVELEASSDIDPSTGVWAMDTDRDGTCVVDRALVRCVLARVRSTSAMGVEFALPSTGFGTTGSDSAGGRLAFIPTVVVDRALCRWVLAGARSGGASGEVLGFSD